MRFMLHAPSQEGLFLDSIKPFDENKHENHDDHYPKNNTSLFKVTF